MWDDPWGSFGAKRKRRSSKPSKLPKRFNNRYHLGRASAEVKILTGSWIREAATTEDIRRHLEDSALRARVVFGEITEKWVGVFSEVPMDAGAVVALTMDQPIRFYCKGEVQRVTTVVQSSRIITQVQYPCRLFIEPQFENEDERKAFLAFVQEINERFIERPFYQWRAEIEPKQKKKVASGRPEISSPTRRKSTA